MKVLDLSFCLILKTVLKLQLTHHGFTISNRHLILNPNGVRQGVFIHSNFNKITVGSLSSIYTWEYSRSFNGKLIDI